MKHQPSVLVFATQYMATGGIESHLKEFCLNLAKTGAKIDLVVTNSAMVPQTEQFFRQICRRVYLGNNPTPLLRYGWLSLIGLRLGKNRYDALYTNGQGESVIYFSKLIPRRARWVHHHHTSGDAADQATWGKRYWQALKQATSVIACSQKNAREMEEVLTREIQSVPCFSREIRRKPQNTAVRIRFGYYGRLIPEKGIDLLCQLSEDPDLKEAEFHLWGEGTRYPPAYFHQFPNVTYHGTFSGTEGLANVIASIDAMLLLSHHPEGLPISLLEAMSAGLPWLATDQGGIPDIALDASSMRVISVKADYPQVKAAVLAFADDLQKGNISSKTQQTLYSTQFSSPVLTAKWKNLLGLEPAID